MAYLAFLLFSAIVGIAAHLAHASPMKVGALYGIASLIAFAVYAMDKAAARAGRWRTEESTLLLLALAGGWPGAILAQQWLRHKTSKRSFVVQFWLSVLTNVAVFAYLASYSPYFQA